MIGSNSTITNQFVPNFNIENILNGQILIYDANKNAFINTSSLGSLIKVNGTQLAPNSVGVAHIDSSNGPTVGSVLGIDSNGDFTYLTLSNGGIASLAGLTDAGISAPVNGEFLKYDSGLWINSNISISDISNINVSTPVLNDVLFYDGANWINRQIDYTDIDNAPTIPVNNDFTFIGLSDVDNSPISNSVLVWDGTEVTFVSSLSASYISGLSTVATSGDYTDLSNKPNMGLYALTSSLSTVALSGNYNDLINKPVLYSTLQGLTDTTITLPSSGQFLTYNGTKWVNANVSVPTALDDLSDTNITGLSTNNVLKYNGSFWVNSSVDWAEVTGKPSQYTPEPHTHAVGSITGLSTWLQANNTLLNFVSLTDANDVIVSDGYLKWNAGGTSIEYVTSIPATNVSGLATVATSGAYADLTGKPTLSTVATSGSYIDLSNKPTLVTNLNGLSDVSIGLTANNQTLVYTGGAWQNQILSYNVLDDLPSLVGELDDLSDVVLTSPTSNQYLKFNGTNWINATIDYAHISNAPSSSSYTFTGLQQTDNVIVNGGYLKWNSGGTSVEYVTSIPAAVISGLSDVATSGDYNDLINAPTLFDGDYASLSNIPSTFAPATHTHNAGQITGLNIPSSLDDLSDVIIITPASGNMLSYNGSNWVNTPFSLSSKSINELSDVTITAVTSAQYLRYNGSQWVNVSLNYNDLINVPATFAPSTHTHAANTITGLNTWLSSNNSLVSFTGLSQTDNTPVANAFLRWDGTGSTISYTTTIPAASVSGLSTVATTGAYSDLSGTPTLITSLDDLSDVVITAPVTNNYLRYNGTNWIPSAISYAHISGAPTSANYTFTGLQQTNDTIVANGYLKWNSGGTSIEYVTSIPTSAITGLSTVATTGAYADLSGKPTIPINNSFSFTGLSDTNNSSIGGAYLKWNALGTSVEYVASIPSSAITGLSTVATTGVYADLSGKPNLANYALTSSLAPVATSGDYNVLINKPNLANYVLVSSLAPVATGGDYSDLTGTPDLNDYALVTSLSTVATTGAYNDLTGKPTIPTNNSFTIEGLSNVGDIPLANGYLRWNGVGNAVIYEANIPAAVVSGLSSVATSGNFNDLSNKPTSATYTFTGLQQTDDTPIDNAFLKWNADGTSISYVTTISSSLISGLQDVAITADYNDLINLPTLFDGDYTSLTNIPTTFTPTAHTHVVADITDFPALVTQLDDLTDVDLTVAPTNGQILKYDGVKWVATDATALMDLDGVQGIGVPNTYLRWDNTGTTVLYEANISAENITGLSSIATSGKFDDITNVDITSVINGDTLVYNSTTEKWENSPQTVSLSGHTLNELDDVVISTPTSGKVLRFNGVNWVDATLSFADISGTPSNASYSFVGLSDTNNAIVNDGLLKWKNDGSSIEYVTGIPSTYITDLATVATTGLYADLDDYVPIPQNINDLLDVVLTSPNDGDLLTFNSGAWVASPLTTPNMSIDDLSDVSIISATTDDVISWNGSSWVNKEITLSMIDGVVVLTPANKHVLMYNGSNWVNKQIVFSDILDSSVVVTLEHLSQFSDLPVSNAFLRWNNSASQVVYTGIELGDLSNVSDVAPVNGQYLVFDGGEWKPKPLTQLISFTSLTDTDDNAVANGILKWNAGASSIEYVTLVLDDLANVDATSPVSGQVLAYDGVNWVPSDPFPSNSWQIKNSNYAAIVGDCLMVDTSSGPINITLPDVGEIDINDSIKICDLNGTFNVNNCTVVRDDISDLIMGSANDLVLSVSNIMVEFVYLGPGIGWKITNGFELTNSASKEITTDTDIYVSTTGDDANGAGTLASPFATIQKALDSLQHFTISRDVYVTINVGSGIYSKAGPIFVSHQNGDRIKIIGGSQTFTNVVNGCSVSASNEFTYSTTSNLTSSISIGDYIIVRIVSGAGANDFKLFGGFYEVTNITASQITVSTNCALPVATPTGVTVASVIKVNAIFKTTRPVASTDYGMVINGQLGLLQGVGIVSDITYNNGYGLCVGATLSNYYYEGVVMTSGEFGLGRSGIKIGNNVGINGFHTGIQIDNQSNMRVSGDINVSYTTTNAIIVSNCSSCVIDGTNNSQFISGNGSTIIYCSSNSNITLGKAIIRGKYTGAEIRSDYCSLIIADQANYEGYNASFKNALVATGVSHISKNVSMINITETASSGSNIS